MISVTNLLNIVREESILKSKQYTNRILKVFLNILLFLSKVPLKSFLKLSGKMSKKHRELFLPSSEVLKKLKFPKNFFSKKDKKGGTQNKKRKRYLTAQNKSRLNYAALLIPSVYMFLLFTKYPDITYELFCDTCMLYFTMVLAGIILISFYLGFKDSLKKTRNLIEKNNKAVEIEMLNDEKIATQIEQQHRGIDKEEIDRCIALMQDNPELRVFTKNTSLRQLNNSLSSAVSKTADAFRNMSAVPLAPYKK